MSPAIPVAWNPENDGKDHINIYSGSKSTPGRFASNFYMFSFRADWEPNSPEFMCVESYWYWLKLQHTDVPTHYMDILRGSYGYPAKKLGGDLVKKYGQNSVADFHERIEKAIRLKYAQLRYSRRELAETGKLPFAHYYVFRGKSGSARPKVVDAGHPWLVKLIEDLRREFQQEFRMVPKPTEYTFLPDTSFQRMPPPGTVPYKIPGEAELDAVLRISSAKAKKNAEAFVPRSLF